MNCEEFLLQFREALDGKVPEQLIQDNVKYYREYINAQAAAGKSEADVLNMLGDPRLLAKTIEESSKFASGSREDSRDGYAGKYDTYGSAQDDGDYSFDKAGSRWHMHLPNIPKWLIVGIVVIAVFSLAVSVFIYFLPVIVVLLIAGLVYKVIRDWMSESG